MKKEMGSIIIVVLFLILVISIDLVSAGLITDFNNWLKGILGIKENPGYPGELGTMGVLTDSNLDNIFEVYDCLDLQAIGKTENLGKNYSLMNDIDCSGFDAPGSWCNGADANKDRVTDDKDAAILAANWGRTDCSASNNWCNGADANKDGTVDDKDASIIGANRFKTGCSGGFVPIGNNTNKFTGTFDGNNHIISNLKIDTTSSSSAIYTGLFGYNYQGIIKNLGLINVQISGKSYVGALVGYTRYGKIENCYSTGSINGLSNMVGGIVGYNLYGTIIKSYSLAEILSSGDYVGGIAGRNNFGTIENCYYAGPEVDGANYVAGITNLYEGSVSTIKNCLALSKRTTGNSKVAGLVYDTGSSSSVIDSYYVNDLNINCRGSCSDSVYGRTSEDLKNPTFSGYSNWDFINTWMINSGEYPKLKRWDSCVPKTCSDLGKNCSEWDDSCGGILKCGYCPAGIGCYNGTCMSCVPKTCRELGKECGSYNNGCGGQVDCPACAVGKSCKDGTCEDRCDGCDYNDDGKVDGWEFENVTGYLGKTCSPTDESCNRIDKDNDGTVTLTDLGDFDKNFGRTDCLASSTPSEPSANLIAHYNLNNNINDIIGGNNGVSSENSGYVLGIVNNALKLDGTNDYASVPGNMLRNVNNKFTLSMWIKPSLLTDSGILGKYHENRKYKYAMWYSSGRINFAIGYKTCEWCLKSDIDGDGYIGLGDLSYFASVYLKTCSSLSGASYNYCMKSDFDNNGYIDLGDLSYFAAAYLQSPVDWETIVSSEMINKPNEWYNVVGTYDRTNLKLYVNGVEVDSKPENRQLNDVIKPLCIGNIKSDCITSSTDNKLNGYYNGIIDELKIWDNSLSASEILNEYNSLKPIELDLTVNIITTKDTYNIGENIKIK
jgi:hypothetical protein